jgi:hypothetical protein
MKMEKENKMMRFLLFVGVVWLISKAVKFMFRSMSQPSQKRERRSDYGVGTTETQPPQMEFKDVQDAKFEDVTEKEKVSK